MSNIPNNGENDQSLRDDLDRLGGAYGQLQHEEPPELLDRAILSSAHRVVEKKPGWLQFGWLHGLTTAAVFVLALSLVFHQREQVPGYQDGLLLDESIGSQREKAAGKRTRDIKTDERSMEFMEEKTGPGDVFKEIRASAPTPDDEMEAVVGEQVAEPTSDTRINTYVAEGLQATASSGDKDTTSNEPAIEELLVDEADLAVDAPEVMEMREQSLPAAIAAAPVTEAEAPAEALDEIEQQVLAILKMKASGDEAWLTELALFKQKYPDYPLPDELLN